MAFADEWLVATLEPLLQPGAIAELRPSDGSTVSLWDRVVQRRLLTDDQVVDAVARRFRIAPMPVAEPDTQALNVVPAQVVRRFGVLPFRVTDACLDVATSNPLDYDAEKGLAFASGREVRLFLASPARIRAALEERFPTEDPVARLLVGFDQSADVQEVREEEDEGASAEEASHAPIVRLVDMMLADGISSRASDIHVEPVEGGVAVRYRIDGVLSKVMQVPKTAGQPLISRLKIMSGLDIADRRRPQDGRARVLVNGDPVDLRVSSLPSATGEKVVIRILNTKAVILELEALGLYPDEREVIRELLGSKEGILLVTGPTGSGKTTTLYSALRMVQGEGVNIVTVEDPVEYKLGENVVQVQVQEKAGLTFASALRSILRQDPDVVLVGEIRDAETAQIAVQASLTGHLVLSTLHTNDAPNTVTRLVDMGLEAYKLGSALRGVVAQRLMRRLCPACTTTEGVTVPAKLAPWIPPGATLHRAVGCSECASTGYRGRFAIVEILVITPELERLIGGGATAATIAAEGRRSGMRSLFESGLRHVLAGHSSVEELLRVTDIPQERHAAPTASASAATAGAHAAPAAPAEEPLSFELLPDAELPPPIVAPPGSKGTVLLVEDEDGLRSVMRDLLERDGFRVVEAQDGVQALDQVDRAGPDIVILDLNLPGLDGYTVLQRLRSRPATARLPVVVLTAKGDEDNELRVFELGADDFLAKPFRARSLSVRLEAVLGRRRRHG
jgi:type II secretory ATPase GspE/PulE/Tfp pilus assembly ATPase PilB-like protein/CheY-like chemotaxis protein